MIPWAGRRLYDSGSRVVLLLGAAAIAFVLLSFSPANALIGPNVCSKQETYTVMVNISYERAIRVRTYTFCLSIPPKCSKYKIIYKPQYKLQSQSKVRTKDICCTGYTAVTGSDTCQPVCAQQCIHGVCEKPEVCRCEAGYSGASCNLTCPEGKWGIGCLNDCPCHHEGKCDPLNGNCTCHAGWIGPMCEHKCPERRYGKDCVDVCRCRNNGSCDHISGACTCQPGWTGPLCEKSCPAGTHGSACSIKCQCQNGGSCEPTSGNCRCPSGWTGKVCANPCPQGTYGENCTYTCDCYNDGSCDHITGKCQCPAGYVGNKCQRECPLGRYGVNCSENCNCKNEGTCSHISGSCYCKEGWLGNDCSKPACPPALYGPGCTNICKCEQKNTERCHPHTGECMCKAGWAGKECTRACPFYKYGEKCAKTCKCRNGAFCDPVNGSCKCAPGYHGKDCGKRCPTGYYGQNCELKCHCGNGKGCHHETGKCQCLPGWTGMQCFRTCPLLTYGLNCQEDCVCKHKGSCDPITGECTCGPGHFGQYCQNTCEKGHHGYDCDNLCACVGPNVENCDPVTGQCVCRPSFRGASCETRCSRGFFGAECTKECDCKNNASCRPDTGKCVCERGWHGADCNTPCPKGKFGVNCNQNCPDCVHGTGSCDHKTGLCICKSGWRGPRCDRTCYPRKWGINCVHDCHCSHNNECNPETGDCLCLPGWRGQNCSFSCPPGKFGYNCLQTCHCINHKSCRSSDGFCECNAGWMGFGCTQTCSEGLYGRQCLNVCNCSSDNYICHPIDGCRCRHGYEGEQCEMSIMDQRIRKENNTVSAAKRSNGAGIWVGVLSIVIVTIFISLILYYRRYIKNLKRELAVVQYTANPPSTESCKPVDITKECSKLKTAKVANKSSDQHHFDNPVYAYQSVSKSQPNLLENGNLNNGVTIRNNLQLKDGKNRQWEKMGTISYDDECAVSLAGISFCGAMGEHYDTPSVRNKALEADATNPNLYHSIESLKDNRSFPQVDHLYDEIKQPHSKEESAYDRLTYSRPVAGHVKPHYYRMAGQLRRSADPLPTPDLPAPLETDEYGTQPSPRQSFDSNTSNELNTSPSEIVISPRVHKLEGAVALSMPMDDLSADEVSRNIQSNFIDDEPKINNLDCFEIGDKPFSSAIPFNFDLIGEKRSNFKGAYSKLTEESGSPANVTATSFLDNSDS